jgi:hypothetical protein
MIYFKWVYILRNHYGKESGNLDILVNAESSGKFGVAQKVANCQFWSLQENVAYLQLVQFN